jgi:hypothetical protein
MGRKSMRCRFTDGEACPRSGKFDVSEYYELSCLPAEGGESPGKQPRGGFKRKIFQVNQEEIMSRNLLVILLVGMFWGCSTYNTVGQKFDTTAINRIELGKTTESEVISMLGAPLSKQNLSNGIVIYSYAYGDRKSLGAESAVDSLQIQLVNGVVINKSQTLSH